MTAQVLVLYHAPADADAFDRYYAGTHTPLAKAIPGLRDLSTSRGPVTTPVGPAPYHVVATLTFDSMADLQAGLGSSEGQAVVADLANFAEAGATVLMFERADM